jgi:Flp pilus assembly protein TadD
VLQTTSYGAAPADLQRERQQLMAKALSGMGKNEDALSMLYTDTSREAALLRLDILWDMQDWPNIINQAEDVLARAHLPERPDWRILSAQGAVADQLGDHQRAQGFYEAALRINPGEPTILSNLGLSYALSKRLPEAERALGEASRHPQADKRVRQNLVLVLGLQGRFAEAERVAATDLPPADVAKAMAQLRQMVSQPNSWDMLRQGGKPAGPRPEGSAAARTAPPKPAG